MKESFEIIAKKYKKIEELPRVTRQEFCDNMDEILGKVDKEKVAYLITDEEHGNLAVCPAEWFDIRLDDDFQLILISAVRYCFRRETYMPSTTVDFVRRHIDCIDDKTLVVMIRDIETEFSHQPLFGTMPEKPLWEAFFKYLKQVQEERKTKG